jgi:hypothetical protein
MQNSPEIKETLRRMSELLYTGEQAEWAESLERLIVQLDLDPEHVCSLILGMFGGVGSLNDLVLYRKGQILQGENQELDELRIKLYSKVREISVKA